MPCLRLTFYIILITIVAGLGNNALAAFPTGLQTRVISNVTFSDKTLADIMRQPKATENATSKKGSPAYGIASLASAALAHIFIMMALASPANLGLLLVAGLVLSPLAVALGMVGLNKRLKAFAIIGGIYGILVFVPAFILILFNLTKF